jgi:hypothetical protein
MRALFFIVLMGTDRGPRQWPDRTALDTHSASVIPCQYTRNLLSKSVDKLEKNTYT